MLLVSPGGAAISCGRSHVLCMSGTLFRPLLSARWYNIVACICQCRIVSYRTSVVCRLSSVVVVSSEVVSVQQYNNISFSSYICIYNVCIQLVVLTPFHGLSPFPPFCSRLWWRLLLLLLLLLLVAWPLSHQVPVEGPLSADAEPTVSPELDTGKLTCSSV